MEELIGQLIADFHDMPLPRAVPRRIVMPRIERKANAVIGMRRTGKTYLLFQMIRKLEEQGVPRNRMLYLNFDDERLMELDVARMRLITEVYFRRFPENRRHTVHLFFDEIQMIPGWERYVRRLIDTEDAEICLTGSSAQMLSREIATSMRGRAIATALYPFSFAEALVCEGADVPADVNSVGKASRSMLENRVLSYLQVGGFPETQKLSRFERVRVLQDYVNAVMFRDIVERHGVENLPVLRYMVHRLLGSPARLMSVHKLFNEMKSQGYRCAKGTLYAYLEYLHDSFLLFPVPIHAASARVRMSNPQKICPVDPGLCAAFLAAGPEHVGSLLELAVHTELRRRNHVVEYVVTDQGYEVDFLATGPGGEVELIQVCQSLVERNARERELRALREAIKTVRHAKATVVTLADEETTRVDGHPVRVIPAWKWLLAWE